MRKKYKGYKNKRSFIADSKRKAKYRPAKKYRKGMNSQGDWQRKKVRKHIKAARTAKNVPFGGLM